MMREQFPKITLEAARVNRHMSQKDAAEYLGISRSSLQNYENGRTVPNWEVVRRMERVYKLPCDLMQFPDHNSRLEDNCSENCP